MAMTTTLPSDEVQAKAKTLVELRAQWATIRDKHTGWRRVVMPSLTTAGQVYYVHPSGDACSCPGGRRGLMCCHRLAARTIANRDALAAWVDEQERSTGNRAGVLGYLDAVSEGADHETARAAGHRARVRYEQIWPEGD